MLIIYASWFPIHFPFWVRIVAMDSKLFNDYRQLIMCSISFNHSNRIFGLVDCLRFLNCKVIAMPYWIGFCLISCFDITSLNVGIKRRRISFHVPILSSHSPDAFKVVRIIIGVSNLFICMTKNVATITTDTIL